MLQCNGVCRSTNSDDGDIATPTPDLRALFRVPAPAHDVVTGRYVRDMNFVHHRL